MIFKFVPEYKNTEKRELTTFSLSENSSPWDLVNNFTNFFNDNFGFRTWLIHNNTYLTAKYLRTSAIPYVTIGKDGWLFYTSESLDDGQSTNDYQGLVPLDNSKLEAILENLSRLDRNLEEKGIIFMVLVAPNKQTIYGDYLPDNLSKRGHETRFDQIKRFLVGKDINFLEVRSILQNPPENYPTFYKTDTHWNTYGAYLTAKLLMEELNKIDPKVEKIKNQNFTFDRMNDIESGDIATMLSLEEFYKDEDISIKSKNKNENKLNTKLQTYKNGISGFRIKSKNDNGQKIIVFSDSYGAKLIPFISPHFTSSLFLGGGKYRVDENIVDSEKPDIVVWEVAERFVNLLSNP